MVIFQIGEKIKLHHYFKKFACAYWNTYSYALYFRVFNYRFCFRFIPKFNRFSKDRRRFLLKIEKIWR